MRVLWVSNGLNIVLDPIFIFGWGPIPAYGITGAAIATNLGRGIGVLFQLWLLFQGGKHIKILKIPSKIRMGNHPGYLKNLTWWNWPDDCWYDFLDLYHENTFRIRESNSCRGNHCIKDDDVYHDAFLGNV